MVWGRCRSLGKNILIVDDNAVIRRSLGKLLAREGWQIREAVDGEDAIAKARESQPDLIVLDYAMPDMNGLQAALQLRRLAEVPIILFTAFSAEQLEALAAEAGVSAVVSKADNVRQLINHARSLLGECA